MWGLEYALLFGVPGNKLELMDGKSRCAFPFLDRAEAEAHFTAWIETLCRWKGVADRPAVRKGPRTWEVEAAGFVLELFPRPIDLDVPLAFQAFDAFHEAAWRREFWAAQPPGREAGWEWSQRHFDVQLNLWSLFGDFCKEHGGAHGGRSDVALSDTAAVAPDQYYFGRPRAECMIDNAYFHGVPDLIAEVLSPASRQIDRGPRKDLYRRSGVRHLWLLDPELETVELYELAGAEYRLTAAHGAGAEFRPALFPDAAVSVDALFKTQWKKFRDHFADEELEPVAEWLLPPEMSLGLEHFFLLGHPERRWEIWGNRAPCVLPFGSTTEARVRLGQFLEDAARWEQAPVPRASALAPDVEQAEVGRFRFTRRGRQVWLDVAVDARKYRDLLRVWARREAWNWGEKESAT